MAATKTVRKPYSVQRKVGVRISSQQQEVLRLVCDKLAKRGVDVLGTLFCRTPGFCSFFATAFEMSQQGATSPSPLGCVRVSFLRNGEVTVRVMGTKQGQYEIPFLDVQWN